MGRRRKDIIVESADDLRRLSRQYAGKPQQGRLLFLAFLKENPTCSIPEGAEAAGISKRQGRYLWEDYQSGGLEQVLGRRAWQRKGEKPPATAESASCVSTERVAGMSAVDLLGFMNAVAELGEIIDPYTWARRLGDILMEFIPEVDYAVVSISHNTLPNPDGLNFTFHQHRFPDGNYIPVVQPMDKRRPPKNYELIAEHGRKQGFPFLLYHSPLTGIDLYAPLISENGILPCAGSIMFFRHVDKSPFSPEFLGLVEQLRPFLTLMFTHFILHFNRSKPIAATFSTSVENVAGGVGLSKREQDILVLLLLGKTHGEIAHLLNITPATVSKHARSIYKKAGVRRLSEFFARYFTPLDYSPKKGEKREE